MKKNDTQRRHFTRILFDTEYRLVTADNRQAWQGKVIDLSLKGALIQRPQNLEACRNDEFLLELILGAEEVRINMEVRVAHIHDNELGFECLQIDVDSMTHLRRILELNLGDPDLLEREIHEMLTTSPPQAPH